MKYSIFCKMNKIDTIVPNRGFDFACPKFDQQDATANTIKMWTNKHKWKIRI